MSHEILKTEQSPEKQSWAGMRKECMSRPAGVGTARCLAGCKELEERESLETKRLDNLPGSGQLSTLLKLTAKNLILSKILAIWYKSTQKTFQPLVGVVSNLSQQYCIVSIA